MNSFLTTLLVMLLLMNSSIAERSNRSNRSVLIRKCKKSVSKTIDKAIASLHDKHQCNDIAIRLKLEQELIEECNLLSERCKGKIRKCLQKQKKKNRRYTRRYCKREREPSEFVDNCYVTMDRLLDAAVNSLNEARKNDRCNTEDEQKGVRRLLQERCNSLVCETEGQACLSEFSQLTLRYLVSQCVDPNKKTQLSLNEGLTPELRFRTCMHNFGSFLRSIVDKSEDACGSEEHRGFLQRYLHLYCSKLPCEESTIQEFKNCFLPRFEQLKSVISVYCAKSAQSFSPALAMAQAQTMSIRTETPVPNLEGTGDQQSDKTSPHDMREQESCSEHDGICKSKCDNDETIDDQLKCDGSLKSVCCMQIMSDSETEECVEEGGACKPTCDSAAGELSEHDCSFGIKCCLTE